MVISNELIAHIGSVCATEKATEQTWIYTNNYFNGLNFTTNFTESPSEYEELAIFLREERYRYEKKVRNYS